MQCPFPPALDMFSTAAEAERSICWFWFKLRYVWGAMGVVDAESNLHTYIHIDTYMHAYIHSYKQASKMASKQRSLAAQSKNRLVGLGSELSTTGYWAVVVIASYYYCQLFVVRNFARQLAPGGMG